jgi:hypothetical protein
VNAPQAGSASPFRGTGPLREGRLRAGLRAPPHTYYTKEKTMPRPTGRWKTIVFRLESLDGSTVLTRRFTETSEAQCAKVAADWAKANRYRVVAPGSPGS